MRILAIHHTSALGGGSTSFLDILSMLEQDHEVVVCCPSATHGVPALLRDRGATVVANPAPFPTFDHYEGAPSPVSNRLMRPYRQRHRHRRTWADFVRAQHCDLVLVNSSTLAPLHESFEDVGIPSLLFVRETIPDPRSSWRSRMLYRAINRFDASVYISSFDREQAAPQLEKPTAVVRDSFHRPSLRRLDRGEAHRQLSLTEGGFNVLFTGGGLWYKGLDVLVDAIAQFQSDEVRILVAGYPLPTDRGAKRFLRAISPRRGDRFVRRVQRRLNAPKVRSRVVFMGPLSDMSTAYSAADAMAFPAQVPHQSRPLFEASMYSLPVIITDFEQYREHLVSGFFVGPRDSHALAHAINTLRLNPELRTAMGAENREMAIALHSHETEKQTLLNLVARFEPPRSG